MLLVPQVRLVRRGNKDLRVSRDSQERLVHLVVPVRSVQPVRLARAAPPVTSAPLDRPVHLVLQVNRGRRVNRDPQAHQGQLAPQERH